MSPDDTHPISFEPSRRRARARFAGHVIADTDDALIVHEAGLAAVVYFPRDAVEMDYFGETERTSRCPYKGEARYWTLTMEGKILENVAWAYDTPLEGMEALQGRVAFYDDKVEVYFIDQDELGKTLGHEAAQPV